MARPQKIGLDYFPHDVDSNSNMNLKFIEASHGLIGYGIYFKLLETIYRNGYYVDWTERNYILFSFENKIEVNVCRNVVNDCINDGLFDINLFNEYNILTSEIIQKTYLKGCERRKKVIVNENYLLIDIMWTKTELMSTLTLVNNNISTQSKGNKSKVNKSKVKGEKDENMPPENNQDENFDFSENGKKETEKKQTEKMSSFAEATEDKEKKDSGQKIESYPGVEIIQNCKDFFSDIATGYIWEDRDAKALEQLLVKLKISYKLEDQNIIRHFQYFLSILPKYWRTKKFTLPLLNLNYNEIINEIETSDTQLILKQNDSIEKFGRHTTSDLSHRAESFARPAEQ